LNNGRTHPPETTMQFKFATLVFAIAASALCSAHAMTKDEYKTAKDKIEADYKSEKKACDGMKANAKDVCEKEAKGKEKVAKAELEQNYKPSGKNSQKVAVAKADSEYDVAKEKCEEQKGDAEKSCKQSAKVTHESAVKAAKRKS
jgi:hypothetical protein